MSMAGADEPAAGDAAGVPGVDFGFAGLVDLRAFAVFLAMLLLLVVWGAT